MQELTFITGNEHKAKQLSEFIEYPVTHVKLDLVEIQSVDLQEIILHKVTEAYTRIKKPLLVTDIAMTFHAFGKLPGPYIKYFLEEVGNENMCRMLDPFSDRSATATSSMGYHDGNKIHVFTGEVKGSIAKRPSGTRGYGWDPIFVPHGYSQTRAEMHEKEYFATSPTNIATTKLHDFLSK